MLHQGGPALEQRPDPADAPLDFGQQLIRPRLRVGAGEVVGTGLLSALVSAWIVGPLLMGKSMALATLVIAFSISTLGGTILAIVALHILRKAKVWTP